MANVYRIDVSDLMDYGENWKKVRKDIPEYTDDHNQYFSYMYETSFDDCIKAIIKILNLIGINDPEYSVYKWKTLKNKSQRWTVTVETLLTHEYKNCERKIEPETVKVVITEFKTY